MLHNTLDTQISKLHAEGIGATINQASIISYEGEYQLLHCKVMSFQFSFFYAGLHCCLQGGQERDLSLLQFQRFPPDNSVYDINTYYIY